MYDILQNNDNLTQLIYEINNKDDKPMLNHLNISVDFPLIPHHYLRPRQQYVYLIFQTLFKVDSLTKSIRNKKMIKSLYLSEQSQRYLPILINNNIFDKVIRTLHINEPYRYMILS